MSSSSRRLDAVIRRAEARLAAAGVEEPRREALLLARLAMAVSPAQFYATRPEYELSAEAVERLEELLDGRARRVPLAYLTGIVEFYGREFAVDRRVLIPRPETEHVVEAVLHWLQQQAEPSRPWRIADLGTGSGILAVTLSLECANAVLLATDVSADCLDVARGNAQRHGVAGNIRFEQGSWFEPLRRLDWYGAVDVIVSNPPYIDRAERERLQPEVCYEPEGALFAEKAGLQALFHIIDGAPHALGARGALFLEIGAGQFDAVSARMLEVGLAVRGVRDYAGHWRVAIGEKQGTEPQ